MTCRINQANWIIKAIGKHVIAYNALSCAGESVCVEEAADIGGVVAGLEVVQAGAFIHHITAVGQGIGCNQRSCQQVDPEWKPRLRFPPRRLSGVFSCQDGEQSLTLDNNSLQSIC